MNNSIINYHLDVLTSMKLRYFWKSDNEIKNKDWVIAISPSGKCIACGNGESCMIMHAPFRGIESINTWQLSNCVNWIHSSSADFAGLAFSADGEFLFSKGDNGQLKTWRLKNGSQVNDVVYEGDHFSTTDKSKWNRHEVLFKSGNDLYVLLRSGFSVRLPSLSELKSCEIVSEMIAPDDYHLSQLTNTGQAVLSLSATDKLIACITAENELVVFSIVEHF